MYARSAFTYENIDCIFSRLAKTYRKLCGKKMTAEIVLIGGAAILANYSFRESTYDIDALINASEYMKDAINIVGDEMGLPNSWINSDFVKTPSYSPHLILYSKFYKRFSSILDVRIVTGEYLIAMKLMSARQYKHDISDVIGILIEEKKRGNNISLTMIQKAVVDLYGKWERIPEKSRKFSDELFFGGKLEFLYEKYRENEIESRALLTEFKQEYQNVLNGDNINDVLEHLKKRKNT